MNRNRIGTAAFLSMMALGACTPTARPMAEPDAGTQGDASTEGPSCGLPTGTYGATVGRTFRELELNECDGTPFTFYNEDFCSSTFTVVSIAAGWCQPCHEETRLLEEHLTQAYADRGVRVIQILIQDENYRVPTERFCNNWVSRYGLTNTQLLDPEQISNIYFPDNSLPSTIIVDRQGVIRFRENGVSDMLGNLTNKLDELLAETE